MGQTKELPVFTSISLRKEFRIQNPEYHF